MRWSESGYSVWKREREKLNRQKINVDSEALVSYVVYGGQRKYCTVMATDGSVGGILMILFVCACLIVYNSLFIFSWESSLT